MEREQEIRVERDRCPFCHEDVEATPERTACNACAAWHHQACWDEHGRCSACGYAREGAEHPAGTTAPARSTREDPGARAAVKPGEIAAKREEGCQADACTNPVIYRDDGLLLSGGYGRRLCYMHARSGLLVRFALLACMSIVLALASLTIVLVVPGEDRWIAGLSLTLAALVTFGSRDLWKARQALKDEAAQADQAKQADWDPSVERFKRLDLD